MRCQSVPVNSSTARVSEQRLDAPHVGHLVARHVQLDAGLLDRLLQLVVRPRVNEAASSRCSASSSVSARRDVYIQPRVRPFQRINAGNEAFPDASLEDINGATPPGPIVGLKPAS